MLKFILFFILISCSKEYNVETCNELSMKKFKGVPNSSYEFDQNCKDVQIRYTQELCHSALVDLTMKGNLKPIHKKYGSDVDGCFTAADLKRFHD